LTKNKIGQKSALIIIRKVVKKGFIKILKGLIGIIIKLLEKS